MVWRRQCVYPRAIVILFRESDAKTFSSDVEGQDLKFHTP